MGIRKSTLESVGKIMFDLSFYSGKKVFVTGHTGFKGSWLCKMLVKAGAEVTGYSLNPPTKPALFEIAVIEKDIYEISPELIKETRIDMTILAGKTVYTRI